MLPLSFVVSVPELSAFSGADEFRSVEVVRMEAASIMGDEIFFGAPREHKILFSHKRVRFEHALFCLNIKHRCSRLPYWKFF